MDSLLKFPLLAGMTKAQAIAYGERCLWKTYEAGEMIIDHHEDSNDVRFIVTGTVRIVVRMVEGREVIFNDYEAGDFFGELAAIDGGPRSANVSAKTKSHICIMPQSVFRQMCEDLPDVSWRLMGHLTTHIRRLSERLSEYSFLKAKHRLYAELLRMCKPRNGSPDQKIISPSPRQSDIADRIASRREIVSREMKELERRDITMKTRGGLVITQPDILARLAAEGWEH